MQNVARKRFSLSVAAAAQIDQGGSVAQEVHYFPRLAEKGFTLAVPNWILTNGTRG